MLTLGKVTKFTLNFHAFNVKMVTFASHSFSIELTTMQNTLVSNLNKDY